MVLLGEDSGFRKSFLLRDRYREPRERERKRKREVSVRNGVEDVGYEGNRDRFLVQTTAAKG